MRRLIWKWRRYWTIRKIKRLMKHWDDIEALKAAAHIHALDRYGLAKGWIGKGVNR